MLVLGSVPSMPFHEILKQTLSALWETKLRSFLTMFGIVWGITSVILLVGLGIGFNIDQKTRLRSIGTDIAIFFGGKTGIAGRRIRRRTRHPSHGRRRHRHPAASHPRQNRQPRASPHRLRGQPVERRQPGRPRRLAPVPALPLPHRRAGPSHDRAGRSRRRACHPPRRRSQPPALPRQTRHRPDL